MAPFPHLDAELHRIALARALRQVPPALLSSMTVRVRAYAAAGLAANLADGADAADRARIYREQIAPQSSPVLQPGAAA
jgi:hypothetical protein